MTGYPSTYTGYQCQNPRSLVHDVPISRHISLNHIKDPKISLKRVLDNKRKTELVAQMHESAMKTVGHHPDEKARIEIAEEDRKHYF